jgi:hypothetical protein
VLSRTLDTDEGPVTLTESVWTEEDRGLLLALLAEQNETCKICGHQMSVCRDPRTAGTWQVVPSICQPGRVMAAEAENAIESKRSMRGVVLGSKRSGG